MAVMRTSSWATDCWACSERRNRVEDHADRAVTAALEIVAAVRERYRGELEVGVGVNSGRVIAGTVGGGGRVEFSVIGDAVNTAARVEAATRETGDDVLITDFPRALLSSGRFELEPCSPVELKGKREQVGLWALRPAPAVPDRRGAAPAARAERG